MITAIKSPNEGDWSIVVSLATTCVRILEIRDPLALFLKDFLVVNTDRLKPCPHRVGFRCAEATRR